MNAAQRHCKFLPDLVRQLGWGKPTRHEHTVRPPSVEATKRITWFESGGMDDILLQVNTNPGLHAAVYAIRYRICTGWHALEPLTTQAAAADEAARLEPWLARHWFTSLAERRRFRRMHPECASCTLRRLREDGPPHVYKPTT